MFNVVNMVSLKKYLGFVSVLLLTIFLGLGVVNSTQGQVDVQMDDYVNQVVVYNPLVATTGTWVDANENQTSYNMTGKVTVRNINPNGKTISDIYLSFVNTGNITSTPTLQTGRTGTWVDSTPADGLLVLHIPELRTGENSTWVYNINSTSIRPPLNFTSNYSATKVLAGDNITITDTIENVFDNLPSQTDTCIYGINITGNALSVNFSNVPQNFTFYSTSTTGFDASNVTYDSINRTQYWDTLAGGCLYKGNSTSISYNMATPYNIPATKSYRMVNTTLIYMLNNSISHISLSDITAVSEANVSFEKKIIGPSDPLLYGSNVTWNVTGYFKTGTNITYNLTHVTFWVSQRNVNGSYTDPNTVDNDTISNVSLNISSNPFVYVNKTAPWASSSWYFNYSDIPSPIVWMDVNFTIANDGVQFVNRSFTQNGNDIYIKELYLIVGYWLEINKNITSIGQDKYHVRIDVHNKGNQVTPADTVVTIYDFVPSNFNLSGSFVYSASPWYSTTHSNNSIIGLYNGTLHQWALLPTNALNTSFAQGPAKNQNTTWSVDYNVTGLGDYTVLDVFITGLDPQQVDGAGSTTAVVVEEILDKINSTEGVFATVASVLLLLGLLL